MRGEQLPDAVGGLTDTDLSYVDLLFTVPPGPESEFVESEDPDERGINVGEWIAPTTDQFWRLRIRLPEVAYRQGRADLAAALAHVVRDHDMPQKRDQHGYDYRMGWWDAVVQADRIIRGGLRVCDDCPGKPPAADSTPRESQPLIHDGDAAYLTGGA